MEPLTAQDILSDESSTLPVDTKQLSACRVCALVKTQAQFNDFGCNNCSHGDQKIWDAGSVAEMTTVHFSGVIAMLRPSESWVGKWQFMRKNYIPGLYAIQVEDRLTAREALEYDHH